MFGDGEYRLLCAQRTCDNLLPVTVYLLRTLRWTSSREVLSPSFGGTENPLRHPTHYHFLSATISYLLPSTTSYLLRHATSSCHLQHPPPTTSCYVILPPKTSYLLRHPGRGGLITGPRTDTQNFNFVWYILYKRECVTTYTLTLTLQILIGNILQ